MTTAWNRIEHPNIAHDGEIVNGRSLTAIVAEGRVAIERASHIVEQALAALGAAHRQGIVHGALSLDSIVVFQNLGDPDFVKVLSGTTSAFPAPEGGSNALTDIYALGCVGYTLISGAPPTVEQARTNVREVVPGVRVPFGLGEWVSRLMAPNAKDRFQSADEAKNALRRIYASRSMIKYGARPIADAVAAVPPPPPPPPKKKLNPWIIGAVIAVIAGALVGVAVWRG